MNEEHRKTLAWEIYTLALEEYQGQISREEFVERSTKCIDEAVYA